MLCLGSYSDPSLDKTNYILNIVMHSSILFIILSVLFHTVISEASAGAVNSTVSSLSDANLGPYIREATQDPSFKSYLESVDWNTLKKKYNSPTIATQTNNAWLYKYVTLLDAFLVIIIVCSIVVVYMSCSKCLSIKSIFVENLLSFIFIGVIEFLFFESIIINYAPVLPSEIATNIVHGVGL